MAIQGIIKGFCDPIEKTKNVILVGRGSNYVMVENCKTLKIIGDDIADADSYFQQISKKVASGNWVAVRGVSTDAMGNSIVVGAGSSTFADYLANYDAIFE